MKISKILTAAFSALFILGSYSFFGLSNKVNAATITVNDWDSLNQAVSNAADGDEITIDADITTQVMISVNKSITIDLNGHTLTRDISSADADGHVIYIAKGGSLTLNDGVITGGFADRGGGIYNAGTITMENCVITGNTSNEGGGIYNAGTITMENCEITGNTSKDGGGIYNLKDAEITLTNVEISGNESKSHGGGGITNYGNVNINDCSITGNKAASNGAGIWNNRGLYIQGKVTVKENSSGTGADNIFVKAGQLITITGALDSDSYIGISLENLAQPVTVGWTANAGISDEDINDIIHLDYGMIAKVSSGEIYVGGVPYVSRAWDDETQSVKSSDEVYTETVYNIGTSVGGGWYYVYGKKDIGRITLSNNTTVNIILADGAELKCGGIFVPENTILNIYGQKNGTGKLIAKADEEYQAGIGGNDERGHGQINIYGGTIEATGNDYGAGIGSGDEPGGKSLGDIQIFGGNITAQGGEEGAGIGGGNESKGANIYIYGGYIVARGDNPSNTIGGAGIGGGDHAGAGHIEIKGGTIRATGGRAAAGIGGGPNEDVNNGEIIISGGDINAAGGYYGAGIGSGINSDFAGTIIISGGKVDAYCELNGAGIGAGSEGDLLGTITISGGEVRANAYGELKVEKYVNEVFYKFSCGAGIGAGASGGGGQNAQITISGGSVYSKSDYGGAAIGAGSRLYRDEKNKNAGAFLGTVTISGGDLKLWANTNRLGNAARLPETIGRGVDCGSDYGTVIIGDGMCVARETDYPVSYSDRENASRSYYSGATIIIEPCNNHTVDTFTSDSSSTHSGNCKYCNEFVEENHKMQGNTCTVCGYVDDSIVKVAVAAGDGTGTSVITWETIGDEYTLPECSFTAPSGKVFEKWTVKSGTSTLEKTAGDIITINGETTITAQYRTLNEYKIRFVNYDDNPLSEIKVTEGQLPEYSGAAPSKPGDASYKYVFAGWDKEIVPANANAVYKATFNEIGIDATEYEITFVDDDGNELWSGKFEEGTTPAYPLGTPIKEADAEYTYSFDGWTPEIDVVTEDKTYTATFAETKRSYTILFINEDGTLLQSIDVEYGETPVFDETITPLKVSDEYYTYEFDGWDKEIAEVTGEAVYTAQFKAVPKNFDIRFVNYDDSLLQYVEVPYGTMPSYTGDTPVKPGDEQYSYTFLSWTPSIEAVEGAATYKATYYSTTNKYTVTFENEDGTVLQSQTLEYGEMPSYKGSTPEKEEDEDYIYSFAGWDAQISKVTEDVVYTATYNAIEKTATVYTIKFVNDDGTVLQTVKVAQGDMPEYTMGTDPVKKADNDYSYEFTGWTPAVTKATADATYKATYKATPIKQVYNFVEGSTSVYVQGSGEGLVETVKCTIDDPNSIDRVLWVAVDGTQLTLGKEYSLKQGSTIVTLFSSYLDTLSAGEHVLLVNFTDGSVSMKFTIEAKDTSGASIPATGEEMNTTNISIALLLVAASLGCIKYVVRTKRREEEK